MVEFLDDLFQCDIPTDPLPHKERPGKNEGNEYAIITSILTRFVGSLQAIRPSMIEQPIDRPDRIPISAHTLRTVIC